MADTPRTQYLPAWGAVTCGRPLLPTPPLSLPLLSLTESSAPGYPLAQFFPLQTKQDDKRPRHTSRGGPGKGEPGGRKPGPEVGRCLQGVRQRGAQGCCWVGMLGQILVWWAGAVGQRTVMVRVVDDTPEPLEKEPSPRQNRGFPLTGEGLLFHISDPH